MPAAVDKIVRGIKKDHPDWPEEKVWAIAYSVYKKEQNEGISGREWGYGYKNEILDFFARNPEATSRDVLQLAAGLGCDVERLIVEIHKLLHDFIAGRGPLNHPATGAVDFTKNFQGRK